MTWPPELPRQQFGEATGAAAEIEDQQRCARIDVIRQ